MSANGVSTNGNVIRQGDVFWLDMGLPVGSRPAFRRPYVVVQNNVLNQSRIQTTVVCAVTTNLRWASAPGNVLLDIGEANLPRRSVVDVTQVNTEDKRLLTEYIGTLRPERVQQIAAGLRLVLEPRERYG